jgi:hypothetical protein
MFFGCQENSITDPETTSTRDKVKTDEVYKHDFIQLQATLIDPKPVGNSYYIINGQIEYEHRMFGPIPSLPPNRFYVSLSLSINADLRYFCSVCPLPVQDELAGFISENIEEYVPLNEHFIALLEKTFIIQGSEDGMVLKCRFLVTYNGIQLSAMWLALQNKSVTATVNQ